MSDIEKMRDIAKRAIEKKYYFWDWDSVVCETLCEKIKVHELTDNITGEVYYDTVYCAIVKSSWSRCAIIVEAEHTGTEIGEGFVLFDDEVLAMPNDSIVTINELSKFAFDTIMEAKNEQNNNG